MKLSILNQVRISAGSTAARALKEAIALAQLAEELGYHRYWIAEHHSAETACPAPEVLLAAIGAETSQLRIGAGGILLPHYSAFKVAECFRMLERLYTGRIDLGIGRSTGAGATETAALQRHRVDRAFAEDFGNQLVELLQFLRGTFPADHPFRDLAVGASQSMPVWLLGSSEQSAATAAALDLPYAYAQFISPQQMEAACRAYRAGSAGRRAPGRAILALSAICVESKGDVARLVGSGATRPEPKPGASTSVAVRRPPGREWEKSRFVGTPDVVAAQVSAAAAVAGVDELMVLAPLGDHEAHARSYRLLAEAFGLPRHGRQAAMEGVPA